MLSRRCNCPIKSRGNCKKSQRLSKVQPITNKYNWKEMNYASKKKKKKKNDLKKFEENNSTIALIVLYVKK